MQSQLIVGDSLNMLDTYADYPESAGWVLKTSFTPRSGSTRFVLTATAEGDSYRTTALPSVTATWVAGEYTLHQWVEKAGQRVTLATAPITLLPDPNAVATDVSFRSHAERTLSMIEAMIEGKATRDVQEYSINGRMMKHIPIAELLKLRATYSAEVAAERRAKGLTKGFGSGRKILTRF